MKQLQPGLLMIEVVVILVVLGLLTLVAVPKYWDTRAERRKLMEKSMAAAIRSEIFAYHVEVQSRTRLQSLSCEVVQNTTSACWPAALDQAGIGANNGLFSFVLRTAATRPDDGWTVVGPGAYHGPYGGLWVYDGNQGTFLCRGWCP